MLEATVGKAYRHDVPATDANGDTLIYNPATDEGGLFHSTASRLSPAERVIL